MIALLFVAAASSLPACDVASVCFSPKAGCDDVVVSLIAGAVETLDVAAYGLNRPPIVEALIAAKKRGVSVRIVLDRLQASGRKEKPQLTRLTAAGIEMKRQRHSGLMHDKFMVVDGERIEMGSFNFTNDAVAVNDENLLVLECHELAVSYAATFEKMWEKFALLQ